MFIFLDLKVSIREIQQVKKKRFHIRPVKHQQPATVVWVEGMNVAWKYFHISNVSGDEFVWKLKGGLDGVSRKHLKVRPEELTGYMPTWQPLHHWTIINIKQCVYQFQIFSCDSLCPFTSSLYEHRKFLMDAFDSVCIMFPWCHKKVQFKPNIAEYFTLFSYVPLTVGDTAWVFADIISG